MMRVTVLYEDQRGGAKGFGPHELLIACLADRSSQDRKTLASALCDMELKGDGNLKAAVNRCRTGQVTGCPAVALFDEDQVHRCYGLPKDACKSQKLEAIVGQASCVSAVLLERNAEDLLNACCDALDRARPIDKPSPRERDSILQAAAWATPAQRAAILDAMRSFRRLVEKVAELLPPTNQDNP